MGLVEKDGILISEEEFKASKSYDAGDRLEKAKEKIEEKKGLNPKVLDPNTKEGRARAAILASAEAKKAATVAIEAKMAKEYPDNR